MTRIRDYALTIRVTGRGGKGLVSSNSDQGILETEGILRNLMLDLWKGIGQPDSAAWIGHAGPDAALPDGFGLVLGIFPKST